MTRGGPTDPIVPQAVVDRLLGRIDLRALVAESVSVREIDGLVRAPCPFHRSRGHDDDRPLTIDVEAGRVECRTCAFRAGPLGWLAYHDGLTRAEALLELGRRVDVDLAAWIHSERIEAGHNARCSRLGAIAGAWSDALAGHREAGAYLADRGLSSAAVASYGLGWSSSEAGALAGRGDERTARALWQLGILVRRGDGSFAPRFADRVTFPVRDVTGQVVGFGARALDDRRPKYLASPASSSFDRADTLYGLHEALAATVPTTRLILVEGYLDVVSLASCGVDGAVATLGTAVTAGQLRAAFAHVPHVTLCLDGDEAGRRAARATLECALAVLEDDWRLDVVHLPPGEDPDSFVRGHGARAFRVRIADAAPIERALHAELAKGVRADSIGDLARLAATARPLVATIRSPVVRSRLVTLLEGTLGLPWRPEA